MLEKALENLHNNQLLMIPLLMSIVVGAVGGVATGFYLIYRVVTFIGN